MKKNCFVFCEAQARERGKVSVRRAMRQQTTFARRVQKCSVFH
jgi:hypothetical protein